MKPKKKRSAVEILAENTPNLINLKGAANLAGIEYKLLHKAIKNTHRDILHPDEAKRLEVCLKSWGRTLLDD